MPNEICDHVFLRWDMRDNLVTVSPEDENRFCIKVRRAIEILQQADRKEEFREQFNLLLRVLARWLNDQHDIDKAFLTQRDGALAFVLVRKSSAYDEDFEDALSDLDFNVANDPDLNLIRMDAIALPNVSESAVGSFLDPNFRLEYVGHGN